MQALRCYSLFLFLMQVCGTILDERARCASVKVTAALLLRCNAALQTVVDVVDMKIMTSLPHQSTETSGTKGVSQT